MKDFVTLRIVPSRIEAEILKGKLESYGIQCVLVGGDVGGAYPYPMQLTPGVELLVNKKNFNKAKKIIQS